MESGTCLRQERYAQHRNGQGEQAIEPLQKAIVLNPSWLEPRMNLGLLLGELRRFEEGIAVFKDLLKHHPRHGDAYYNLGVLYWDIREREQALAAFKEAVQCNPVDMRARTLIEQLTKSGTPSLP